MFYYLGLFSFLVYFEEKSLLLLASTLLWLFISLKIQMLLSNLQYVVKNEYLEGDAIMKTYSHGGISCPSMSEKIFLSFFSSFFSHVKIYR